MQDFLEQVNLMLEGIELTEVTSEQKQIFRKNFNTSMSIREYAVTEDMIFFIMSENSFGSFEYYAGMEYEREHIELRIEVDGDLLVGYSRESSRAEGIINLIDSDALCDEECK